MKFSFFCGVVVMFLSVWGQAQAQVWVQEATENSCKKWDGEPLEAGLIYNPKIEKVHEIDSSGLIAELESWAQFFEDKVEPGTVVVMGEIHANKFNGGFQQYNQRMALWGLKKQFIKTEATVVTGMEFLNSEDQEKIDEFGRLYWEKKKLLKEDTLTAEQVEQIKAELYDMRVKFATEVWKDATNYTVYEPLIVQPYLNSESGKALGLNIPKKVTSAIGLNGIAHLPKEYQSYVPDTYELGNVLYKERVLEALKNHPGPNGGLLTDKEKELKFEAQSLWDEVMATQIKKHMEVNPRDVVLVIVGRQHVDFGGGLIDRFKSITQGEVNVLHIAQRSKAWHSIGGKYSEWFCDERYGHRADYILVTP